MSKSALNHYYFYFVKECPEVKKHLKVSSRPNCLFSFTCISGTRAKHLPKNHCLQPCNLLRMLCFNVESREEIACYHNFEQILFKIIVLMIGCCLTWFFISSFKLALYKLGCNSNIFSTENYKIYMHSKFIYVISLTAIILFKQNH